ncbi:hypothetical protein D3C72_1307190 [compost metagenome]
MNAACAIGARTTALRRPVFTSIRSSWVKALAVNGVTATSTLRSSSFNSSVRNAATMPAGLTLMLVPRPVSAVR